MKMKKAFVTILSMLMIWTMIQPSIYANEEEFINTYQDVEDEVIVEKDEVTNDKASNLPSRYDTRDYGYVTSVKSQGSLGTCWAYSAIGAAEISLLKQGYVNEARALDLNELQVAYGFYHRNNDPLNLTPNDYAYEPNGDYLMRGGNHRLTALYFTQWASVVNQEDFPDATNKTQVPSNIDEYYNYDDTDYILKNSINLPSEEIAIKEAIIKYGSVAMSYYSIGGTRVPYIYHDDTNQSSNHAVLLVGYDDSISKELFRNSNSAQQVPSRDGAWIMKNSWGTNAGDEGYFYLSYDMTIHSPTVFEFQPRSTYDHNYFYDGGYILNQTNPWNQKKMRMANVFTTKKGDWDTKETLEAVNVGIGSSSTFYSIMIYELNENDDGPLSSKKLLSEPVTGYVVYPGNYTIDLNQSIELEQGSKFSVEVTLSSNGSLNPKIMISQTHNYSWLHVNEELKKGQSYMIYSDTYWLDCKDYGYCARIRAYTNTTRRKEPLPKKVQNLKAKATDYKTIKLTWDPVENATKYAIYRKAPSSDAYVRYKTVSKTSLALTVTTGKQYQFYVRAYNDAGRGVKSDIATRTAKLTGVPKLSITKVGNTRFTLKWSQVDGATRYIIYRKRNSDNYKKVLTLGGDVDKYTTAKMPKGTYYFIVKAGRYDSVDRVMTDSSNECKGTSVYTTPEMTLKKESATSVKLTWTQVEGVQYYHVYRSNQKEGKYTHIKTTTSTTFTNKSLSKGKTYYYKVRGYKKYNGVNIYTKFSPIRSISF